MSKTSESSAPMVPCDFMRAFHRALLLVCGARATQEFWRAAPLAIDGVELDAVAMARHLARDGGQVPLAWACEAMNRVDWFLSERALSVERFLEALMLHGNGGSFVSSRVMLAVFSPLLAALFRLQDPHHLFFRMFTLAGSRFFPGLIFEEVRLERLDAAERRALVLFGFSALWSGSCPPWDGELFTARVLRKMPTSLGLHPFASVTPRADARSIASIVGPTAHVQVIEDRIVIGGESFGTCMPFVELCKKLNVAISDHGQPQAHVAVIERDYVCPVRKRTVLRSGCAYAAPFYLFEARWRLERTRLPTIVQHFVDEVLHGLHTPQAARAEQLEAEFLALAAPASAAWHLSVRTLGGVRVERVDARANTAAMDEPAITRTSSQLHLLTTLATAGEEGMPVAQVARELWPMRTAAASRSALDTALHRLRRRLGDDSLIVLEHGHIRLDHTRVWVDIVAWRELRKHIASVADGADAHELEASAAQRSCSRSTAGLFAKETNALR